MPVAPLIIAGAALGAIGGAVSNRDRIGDTKDALKLLRGRKGRAGKSLELTSQILQGNLTLGAMGATDSSKESSVAAFRAKAEGETYLGQSGLSGGTPFYQLDKSILENQQSILRADRANRVQLGVQELQGEMQIDSLRGQISELDMQIDDTRESLDYYNSAAGWIMSGLTGAMSGAGLGASIEEMGVKALGVDPETGNANWGSIIDPIKGKISSLFHGGYPVADLSRYDGGLTGLGVSSVMAQSPIPLQDRAGVLARAPGASSGSFGNYSFDLNNPSGGNGLDILDFGVGKNSKYSASLRWPL